MRCEDGTRGGIGTGPLRRQRLVRGCGLLTFSQARRAYLVGGPALGTLVDGRGTADQLGHRLLLVLSQGSTVLVLPHQPAVAVAAG